ncbi:MAG: hypothetical protein ACE5E6_01030, partial [Phycisphaerae bacterium]
MTVWPGDGALRTARPGPLKQFEQLVARMEDASAAYYEALDALEARAPDGRPAVHAIEDLPRDERPAILKQMDAVARAAAGTDDAAPLAVGVFSWALYIGDDLALTWLDTLARRYPDEPYLNEYLVDIPDLYRSAGSPQAWASCARSSGRPRRIAT